MTAPELHSKLSKQAPILVLDVREAFELDICKLTMALHVPMGQIPGYIDKLPKDKELVVLCHHGVRSMQVVNFLKQNGFNSIHNLDGGIHAWAQLVDQNMTTY